jgi:DNA-damage-inducible protein J
MAQLNIRVDDPVKEQAEILFKRMGLTMSAAVTIFLRQVILHKAIPFKISAQGDSTLQSGTHRPRQGSRRPIQAGQV